MKMRFGPGVLAYLVPKVQVRFTSDTSPGIMAWSAANAPERSVPVPFTIPMNAIVNNTGRRGDSASVMPPTALNSDRKIRNRLWPDAVGSKAHESCGES